MKNVLTTLVILMLFALAWAADNSCDQHRNCVGGSLDGYNGNGSRCITKSNAGLVNTVGPVNSSDYHCTTYSSKCKPTNVKCNRREIWNVDWWEIVCESPGSTVPTRVRIGWCIDRINSKSSTNLDCSGKKCSGLAVAVEPTVPSN